MSGKPTLPPPAFYRANEVARRVGVHRVTLYQWARAGRYGFPKPVQVYGRHIAWRVEDVEAWIRSREEVDYPAKEDQ